VRGSELALIANVVRVATADWPIEMKRKAGSRKSESAFFIKISKLICCRRIGAPQGATENCSALVVELEKDISVALFEGSLILFSIAIPGLTPWATLLPPSSMAR
jgi:hypothetical protein